eukprot:120992_1
MVKWFLNKHIFEFPWESVTNAWWQKYPNSHSLQVTEVDTIDRKLDKQTGELITRRLISACLHPPAWMSALGFPNYCYVLEETRVNPQTKSMVLQSVNVTGSDLLQVQETCTYKAIDDNKCLYEQSAAITTPCPIFTDAIESFSLNIHSGNASKGLKAMEELCEKYVTLGQQGLQEILNLRLDTILLLTDLETLRTFDLEDFKNLNFVQWTSQFSRDLIGNT